ncbi:MAG: dihydroorotase [Deltaproteobacteria bacterium]|nr:dihydroorotase [Deltaproteobacteria bacterium]
MDMLLIRGGNLVDPVAETVKCVDLLIEGGKIAGISPPGAYREEPPGMGIIEASGMLVVPGLVDMHVHFREPGEEHKETVATGARSAVAGGYTAVACMPNTRPVNDCGSVTRFILDQAQRAGLARVHPIAAITRGQRGKTLTDFSELKDAGAVGLSDDGFPVANSGLMRRALEQAAVHGLKVISHCEDKVLSGKGVMNEGEVSARIGLEGIPAASEEIVVYREIALSRLTGAPVHIAHVSTSGSVSLIRRAKEEGLPVTAETAPHYFTLDHGIVEGLDPVFKVNPPLRTRRDMEAIKEGLSEGVIDVIATDHAPHGSREKQVPFEQAAFGMIGLETALPLTLALVREGVLSLAKAVKKLSFSPARILGLSGGRLVQGGEADLALIDPEEQYLFEEDQILSKSKNSPFIGQRLKGRNNLTMVGGKIVWRR